jgi:hypothetical protein
VPFCLFTATFRQAAIIQLAGLAATRPPITESVLRD